MNYLRVITKPTEDENIFNVYWTNTNQSPRGIVKVRVPENFEDKRILAELYALCYLLEVAEVVGADLAGNPNTTLYVSVGAVKKMATASSAKKHLIDYAKFLTTRFKGCPITVDNQNDRWLKGLEGGLEVTHEIYAEKPIEETIFLHSLGDVDLTSHVVERLAERLSEFKENAITLGAAWRMLRTYAKAASVVEVKKSDNRRASVKYAMKGRVEGQYYLNRNNNWIFVVADGKHGKSLVTAYPITQEFANSFK